MLACMHLWHRYNDHMFQEDDIKAENIQSPIKNVCLTALFRPEDVFHPVHRIPCLLLALPLHTPGWDCQVSTRASLHDNRGGSPSRGWPAAAELWIQVWSVCRVGGVQSRSIWREEPKIYQNQGHKQISILFILVPKEYARDAVQRDSLGGGSWEKI